MNKDFKILADHIGSIRQWAKEAKENEEEYPEDIIENALNRLRKMREALENKLTELETKKANA